MKMTIAWSADAAESQMATLLCWAKRERVVKEVVVKIARRVVRWGLAWPRRIART